MVTTRSSVKAEPVNTSVTQHEASSSSVKREKPIVKPILPRPTRANKGKGKASISIAVPTNTVSYSTEQAMKREIPDHAGLMQDKKAKIEVGTMPAVKIEPIYQPINGNATYSTQAIKTVPVSQTMNGNVPYINQTIKAEPFSGQTLYAQPIVANTATWMHPQTSNGPIWVQPPPSGPIWVQPPTPNQAIHVQPPMLGQAINFQPPTTNQAFNYQPPAPNQAIYVQPPMLGQAINIQPPTTSQAINIQPATTTVKKETKVAKPRVKKEPKAKAPKVKKEPKPKAVKAKKEPAPKTPKRKPAFKLPPEANIYMNDAMRSRVVRAMNQRMFVMSRELSQSDESVEKFEVLGSIGNNYTVTIGPTIKCSCMDYAIRRVHCKHILMILLKVYRLPYVNPIFRRLQTSAPERIEARTHARVVDPSVLVPREIREKILSITQRNHPQAASPSIDKTTERRPLDTSDCPVCFEEFEEAKIAEIDFCKTCGNNVHKECFQTWARSKGSNVSCVYCRAKWVKDTPAVAGPSKKSVRELDPAHINENYYANFADELGIERTRDTSTYKYRGSYPIRKWD